MSWSCLTARGVRPSPQVFSRGKRLRSTNTTSRPCSAAQYAAADPAGPPPMTNRSCRWPGRGAGALTPGSPRGGYEARGDQRVEERLDVLFGHTFFEVGRQFGVLDDGRELRELGLGCAAEVGALVVHDREQLL